MVEYAPPAPVSIDPLIAEARRRARQRRLIAVLALALVLAATTAWLALRSTGAPETGPSRARGTEAALRPIDYVGTSGGVAWAIDPHKSLWLTVDGGRTWRYTLRRDFEPQVQFVDKRHGWMIASIDEYGSTALERTVDGGRTWRVSSLPGCAAPAPYHRCQPSQISFLDARHGYVVATPPWGKGNPRLLWTDDGGASWRLVARPALDGEITFVSRRDGFLFRPIGVTTCDGAMNAPCPPNTPPALYRTTDGGETWSKVLVPPPTSVIRVGRRLVARGSERIYVSRDGGTHWTTVVVPPHIARAGRNFSTATAKMWTFASRNRLYATGDGGRSWKTIVPRGLPRPVDINQIAFSSPRVGLMMVGRPRYAYGTLYRTKDGGRHWTPSACGRAHLACRSGG